MRTVLIIVGALGEMVGWWWVSRRRREVWRLMPALLSAMGVMAVLGARARGSEVTQAVALAAGAGAGAVLYMATRAFVLLASRWEPFRRHTSDAYTLAAGVSPGRALVLSLGVMVPAEELFWRGLTQFEMAGTPLGPGGGAVAAWALYVAANLPSRSLPIVTGAVVGGAVWSGLAWWSGGTLAPLASHILWTGLMLALPPRADRR